MEVWVGFFALAVFFGLLGIRMMRESLLSYKSIIALWENPGHNYTRYAEFWMGVVLTGSATAYIIIFIIYLVNK